MRGRLWNLVQDFCNESDLGVVDDSLPADIFTYLSPCRNTTSWLDHVLCDMNIRVLDITVRFDISLFDHFLFFITIDLNNCGSVCISLEFIYDDLRGPPGFRVDFFIY